MFGASSNYDKPASPYDFVLSGFINCDLGLLFGTPALLPSVVAAPANFMPYAVILAC